MCGKRHIVGTNRQGRLSSVLMPWNWYLTQLWADDTSSDLNWRFVTQEKKHV